jgi:hypothetical protein
VGYIAYLGGIAACLTGVIRASVAIRGFLWSARAGRVIEGKQLLNLALVNTSGIFLVGVQILFLARQVGRPAESDQIAFWPGIAGTVLLTISFAWAFMEKRKEAASKPVKQ